MADLRTLYYDNVPTILTRAVDRSITLTELDPNRRNTRIAILQLVETMKSDLLNQAVDVTVDLDFTEETPSGTMNGSNTTFTLANEPKLASLFLYHNGVRVIRVGSGPATGQFSISTTSITMGLAPNSGDSLVASYQQA